MFTPFQVNQKVFVYTKDGMMETKVNRIHIMITELGSITTYRMDNYDDYEEHQITATHQLAKERLLQNSEQLILMLEA
jgi:hypothetical protein